MSARTGTCNFVNLSSAARYYGSKEEAKAKIERGEICIGEPEKKNNRQEIIVDGEGRYWISDLPDRIGVEVFLEDGTNWKTEINGDLESARLYFLGKSFQGSNCVKVEIIS